MPPRVFTIPSSVQFLPALIGALRDGRVVDGFAPKGVEEAEHVTQRHGFLRKIGYKR